MCLVHNKFDAKCLQVYFIFFQDTFIFDDDVISTHMREMSFAFKNGCVYVLDHWSDMATLVLQQYSNYQGTFQVNVQEAVRNTQKSTGKKKLERSPVPFHNGSQMHRCYSKCEFFSLERHCF